MYKRIRFAFRFTLRLLAKYHLVIVIGLALGIGSFLYLPKLLSKIPALKPQQKIGIIGRHTFIDLPSEITSKISIGLTTIDPSGIPGPGIAESWEATDSGKTYIFKIKPDLHWQDDTKLVSSDLDLRFNDAQVSFPDDSTVVIKLPDPYAPLPVVVSRPILKKDTNYIGVGSYKVSSYRRNGPTLEYLNLDPVRDDLPRLRYLFYQTSAQARTAFKLGLINQIVDLPDLAELSNWPNLTITPQAQTDRYVAVFFNLEHPDFIGQSGKFLRLALAYAIDKSPFPIDRRATGPIGPESWAYNFEVKPYDKDVVRAKDYLSKVEKLPVPLVLHTVPTYFSIAEKIKSDWEAVGLQVDLQVVSEVPESYQALVIAQAVPVDPDQYNLWHSTQKGTSITNLNNPRIDVLLERGRKNLDRAERRTIYQDFQKFLAAEVPAVFLVYPETYSVSRN